MTEGAPEASEPREARPIIGRPIRFAILVALGGVLLVGLAVLHYRSWTSAPLSGVTEDTEVEIERGGFSSTLESLEEAGVVRRDLYFQLFARTEGVTGSIRAGTYVIPVGTTPRKLLKMLTLGARDDEVVVTVPEGYTIYHIADRVDRLGLGTREDFLDAATDSKTLRDLDIDGESAEGFLFPDTYRFRTDTPPPVLVRRMVARHRQVWKELVEEVGQEEVDEVKDEFDLDDGELVTLASIVEREAIVDSERPIIARVFYNRLEKGMKLQTDPTCVYGPKTYRQKPSPRTCRAKGSRYSTYVIDGLPPGPISNPGRASIEAVLTPTTDKKKRDFLYFVAKGGKSKLHTFSKTYKAHKKAVKRR